MKKTSLQIQNFYIYIVFLILIFIFNTFVIFKVRILDHMHSAKKHFNCSRIFIEILLVFIFTTGIFQPLSLWAQYAPGQFTVYGLEQGLSQSTINCVFQDKKGFFWFGTYAGLNRFDGSKFTIYKHSALDSNTLSDNWVMDIGLEDSDGELWILTADQGINRFNPRTNLFKHYTLSPDLLNILQTSGGKWIIEANEKEIWIWNNSKLYQINKNSDKITDYKNKLHEDKNFGTPINGFTDSKGRFWMITFKGLFRWISDSSEFKSYPFNFENQNKNIKYPVLSYFKSKNHKLWIVTPDGINLYNPDNDSFKLYSPGINSMEGFLSIVEGISNEFWIGTKNKLYRFSPISGIFTLFKLESGTNKEPNPAYSLFKDENGSIWVGCSNSVFQYQPITGQFKKYITDEPAQLGFTWIYRDNAGDLWAAANYYNTVERRVFRLNKKQGILKRMDKDIELKFSEPVLLTGNPYVDHTGNIWFPGTGITKYTPQTKKFEHYYSLPEKQGYLPGNMVTGFCIDNQQTIWITLGEAGVCKLDQKTMKLESFSLSGMNSTTFCSHILFSSNQIFISTVREGLLQYDLKTKKSKWYRSGSDVNYALSQNSIRMMTRGPDQKIWIATLSKGIDILDPGSGKIMHLNDIPQKPEDKINDLVWWITHDSFGDVWIACEGSIVCYKPTTGAFIKFRKGSGTSSMLMQRTFCILEDSKTNLWFGTDGMGIALFNRKTQSFKYYTEQNGLSNNTVYAILEDEQGYLWLSTNKGLSKFDPERESFRNFDSSDGLQGNEFNTNAFLKTPDRKMYFGGINGFTAFYPNQIADEKSTPKAIITGLQIFSKAVGILPRQMNKKKALKENKFLIQRINNEYYLPSSIVYTDTLIISHAEQIITFEFAALHFTNPSKTRFRYQMVGFDKEWNYCGMNPFATYTNLPHGTFVLAVSASNPDGIWSTIPLKLTLIVLPPFWKTWWFFTLEIIGSILLIVFLIKIRERQLVHEKTLLEKKIAERLVEINHKNEELKLQNELIVKQKEEIGYQAKQLENELVVQNKASELALLRSQINPHFLFNTLNNINTLVFIDQQKTYDAIIILSEMMRYMLYDSGNERVPLEKEVKYIQNYIELQKMRLRDPDFIKFELNTFNINGLIAPMVFIPFIENAFKHSNKQVTSPGIKIQITAYENSFELWVENHYKPSTTESITLEKGGFGIQNIRRRLELIYPKRHEIEISKDNNKYQVSLKIFRRYDDSL